MITNSLDELSRRKAMKWAAVAATGALVDLNLFAGQGARTVVVWSEGTANVDPASKKVYPNDINTAIAEGLAPLKTWDPLESTCRHASLSIL